VSILKRQESQPGGLSVANTGTAPNRFNKKSRDNTKRITIASPWVDSLPDHHEYEVEVQPHDAIYDAALVPNLSSKMG
jgi:hypothetical protein